MEQTVEITSSSWITSYLYPYHIFIKRFLILADTSILLSFRGVWRQIGWRWDKID